MTNKRKAEIKRQHGNIMKRHDYMLDMEVPEWAVDFIVALYNDIDDCAAKSVKLYSTFSKPRKYNSWFDNK